jgi:hypothetical protein
MTDRRRVGFLILAALLAAPGAAPAQDAAGGTAAAAQAQAQGQAKAQRKPPRPVRRRPRPRPPADRPQQSGTGAPVDIEHRLEAAPVPNRDMEAPRAAQADRTRLSPSVIHRSIPNQNMATEGAPSINEERLFFPAPGARLNVPFSY